MKATIGKHTSPLLDVYSWERSYNEFRFNDVDRQDEPKFIDKLVYRFFDFLSPLVVKVNQKWESTFPRRIKVEYDTYDTWGLDHTLALIIAPGLVQLKNTNHGYGMVDDEDAPAGLSDEARWNFIMDEMIWAFQEIAGNLEGEDQFYSGDVDYIWVDIIGNPELKGGGTLVKGPNHTFVVDYEAKKVYDDRIQRGTMLFGKYYRSLWD